ncbi:MAG: hypothetical protein QY321_02125 [Patescibacteria group bacterium]|nr:MAG: hypothetical protein QY321_02125 [Patescibacteria group bacterium]
MEKAFKLIFFTGVLLFAMISIGIFLFIIRIMLLFNPTVQFLGINFTSAAF